MKIDNQEITFVVQGPIQASVGRQQISGITQQCLHSIRTYFPNSPIILSTWKGQNVENLDYDHLVMLDDPGQNNIYYDNEKISLNNNRQLYSSHMGLKRVETPYAVKIRSDNLLTGRGFLALYQQYFNETRHKEHSYLESRIITSSAFFISSHYGRPVYFHKSDLFDFGLTSDLLKIWPGQPLAELHFHLQPGYKARYPATEQFLFLHWLSILLGQPLTINNKTNENAGLGNDFWEHFIANNIIVAKPEDLSLDVTARFYKRGNLALEYDLADWKYLVGLNSAPFDIKRAARLYKRLCGKLAHIIFQ